MIGAVRRVCRQWQHVINISSLLLNTMDTMSVESLHRRDRHYCNMLMKRAIDTCGSRLQHLTIHPRDGRLDE
jgi:hypothetical protein